MFDPTAAEHRRIRRLALFLTGTLIAIGFALMLTPVADSEPVPEPTPTTVSTTTVPETTTSSSTTTTTPRVQRTTIRPNPTVPTTTTTLVPPNALCGEWWVVALGAGWSIDDLPTLDRIMWNESRCQHDVVSKTNDYGLVQINSFTWRSEVESWGWSMNDLLEPAANLAFGAHVAGLAEDMGWCRYQPWHGFSGDYC